MNTDNDKRIISISGLSIQVVKKGVKNLHLSVLPPIGRVRVTAPLRMHDEAIRMAVISRIPWIKKQQIKFLNQKRQTNREYVSGESHYFLGKPYRLKIIISNDKPHILIKGNTQIIMNISKNTPQKRRDDLLTNWYRTELRHMVDKIVPKWEKKMNVEFNKIGIRRMKTRWGSCNQQKRTIWLNLELIKKPTASIEYVLVHELCHLKEKKHNEVFLALMDKNMPKWRMYKDELNRMPLSYEKWSY